MVFYLAWCLHFREALVAILLLVYSLPESDLLIFVYFVLKYNALWLGVLLVANLFHKLIMRFRLKL